MKSAVLCLVGVAVGVAAALLYSKAKPFVKFVGEELEKGSREWMSGR